MRIAILVREAFGRSRGWSSVALLLLIVAGLLDALALLSVAPVVDLALGPDAGAFSDLTRRIAASLQAIGVEPTFTALLVFFLAVNGAKATVQSLSVYVIVRARYRLLLDLMRGTFADCLGARWEFFTSRDQGTMLNVFVRDLMAVGDTFGGLARMATGTIQLAMYTAVPLYVSWQLTGISLLAGVVLAWPFAALGRMSYHLGRRNTQAASTLTSVFHESFGAAKLVLAFCSQRQALDRFDRAFDAHQHSFIRSQTLSRSIPPFYYPLGLTVGVLVLLSARRLGIPLSETAVVMYSLLRVFSVIGPMMEEKHGIDASFASYESAIAFREQARLHSQPTGQRQFSGLARGIALEHVSFAHPDRPPVLVDVSAELPKGSFVAFVGESGAGKSTVIDLLLGLHAPQAGRIAVDGVALLDFDIASYRSRIGYVPQDNVLFNASIRDNIRWARPDATDAQIEAACGAANATEFIDQLPDGYETVVGDRGVRLSGGQVQRLALARAMVREPDLLLLDEATSALDSFSERLIQQAIESIARSTTVVAIAHRLSTISNADQIYVLSGGKVVEHGVYGALLARGGVFSRMAGLQSLEAHG